MNAGQTGNATTYILIDGGFGFASHWDTPRSMLPQKQLKQSSLELTLEAVVEELIHGTPGRAVDVTLMGTRSNDPPLSFNAATTPQEISDILLAMGKGNGALSVNLATALKQTAQKINAADDTIPYIIVISNGYSEGLEESAAVLNETFNKVPGLRVNIITISDDFIYGLHHRERIKERMAKMTALITDASDRDRIQFIYGTRKETGELLRRALNPKNDDNGLVMEALQEDMARLQDVFAQAQARLAKMQARMATANPGKKPAPQAP